MRPDDRPDDAPCGAVMIDVAVREDDPVDIGKTDAHLLKRFLQNVRGLERAGVEQRRLCSLEKINVYRPRLLARQREDNSVDVRMDFFAAYGSLVFHDVTIISGMSPLIYYFFLITANRQGASWRVPFCCKKEVPTGC